MMRVEAGVAAAAMVAATLIGLGPSAAQEDDDPIEQLDLSPTSGPPGTVITINGENCISTVTGSPAAIVDIELTGDSAEASAFVNHFDIHEGSWSAQLAVPAQADPDDVFTLTATCATLGPEDDHIFVFAYQPAEFHVTATPSTTLPTTTPPNVAPTPNAPPAEPIVAQPTFTG